MYVSVNYLWCCVKIFKINNRYSNNDGTRLQAIPSIYALASGKTKKNV